MGPDSLTRTLPADLPSLPEGWEYVPLEHLVDESRGISYGIVQPGPAKEDGVPIIRVNNIDAGQILTDDAKRISPTIEAKYARSRLRGGEVLITLVGSLGESAVVPSELSGWNVARAVGVIPVLDSIGADWVELCLRSATTQHYVRTWATTTVQATLNLGDLARLPIPLPSPEEREAISSILGALDDKIELNRRTNQTLEEMAHAIFQSWFVDFDPVRAKVAGRQPYGLLPNIVGLFPAAFEASGLGEIPEGWLVRPLDEVANYQNGLALQRYPPEGEDFLPVIKIRELRQGTSDERSGKANLNIRADCIIGDGDVIFSWSGSLLVEIWCGGKGALNQHLFKVTSDEYPRWFYYHWTRHHLPEFQRIAADKATTMGHIKRQHLSESLVIVPPDPVLEAAGRIIEPLIQRIVSNNLQSRTLVELRDKLLPKLISGELRVEEVERFLEDTP